MADCRRRYTPWTAAQRELIRRHYGPLSPHPKPTREIAALVGKSPDDVRAAATRWGLNWRPLQRPRESRLRELYALGLGDRAIGRRVDWSREAVQRWRKRNGLPPVSGRGPGAGISEGLLRELHAAGLDDGRIAERLGCSRARVQRRRAGMGLAPLGRPWGHRGEGGRFAGKGEGSVKYG